MAEAFKSLDQLVREINVYWYGKGYAARARVEERAVKVEPRLLGNGKFRPGGAINSREIVSDTFNGTPTTKFERGKT